MAGLAQMLAAGLWLIFGSVPSIPQSSSTKWDITSDWMESHGNWQLIATSKDLVSRCNQNPDGYVHFPLLINASQQLMIGNETVASFSDPTFKIIRSTYGRPELSCRRILGDQQIVWKVSTDTQYFAHFKDFPQVTQFKPRENVFDESLNAVASGTMLVLAAFCFIIFSGTVSYRQAIAFSAASVSLSVYFALVVPALFSIQISMIDSHRYGDMFLCLGFSIIFYIMFLQNLCRKSELKIYFSFAAFALFLQISGSTSDQIQMGTTSIFIPTIVMMLVVTFRLLRIMTRPGSRRVTWLQFSGLVFFNICNTNDILVIGGFMDNFLFVPIGMIALVMFLALGAQESITSAYRERDYLKAHLEQEVERKTVELRNAQAELIHSARLASLGTLSAGIAHEINNSINFVNGSIVPLERLIRRMELTSPLEAEKCRKLMLVMRDGVKITVDIVRSLRQFTGINQSTNKDILLIDVVRSVLVILGSRLKLHNSAVVDVPEDLMLYGDVVGVNQILMNLITNALDAMPSGGQVTISSHCKAGGVIIEVSDVGHGIPKRLQDRVCDPFFTTKEVGAGTGLGLYIVNNEMRKHGGSVKISSEENSGTTISLFFPERKHPANKEAA